jgi:hypothetical protein
MTMLLLISLLLVISGTTALTYNVTWTTSNANGGYRLFFGLASEDPLKPENSSFDFVGSGGPRSPVVIPLESGDAVRLPPEPGMEGANGGDGTRLSVILRHLPTCVELKLTATAYHGKLKTTDHYNYPCQDYAPAEAMCLESGPSNVLSRSNTSADTSCMADTDRASGFVAIAFCVDCCTLFFYICVFCVCIYNVCISCRFFVVARVLFCLHNQNSYLLLPALQKLFVRSTNNFTEVFPVKHGI